MNVADVAARVEPAGSEQNVIDSDTPAEPTGTVDQVNDVEELPEPESSSSLTDRLLEPLEGSVKRDVVGELWNPSQGGLNRVALVAEEAAGLSDGLPRLAHLIIGAAELYHEEADGLDWPSEPDETDEGSSGVSVS